MSFAIYTDKEGEAGGLALSSASDSKQKPPQGCAQCLLTLVSLLSLSGSFHEAVFCLSAEPSYELFKEVTSFLILMLVSFLVLFLSTCHKLKSPEKRKL